MTRQDIAVVEEFYSELAQGRFGTTWHLLHPEIEFERIGADGSGLTGTVFRGHAELARGMREWISAFDGLQIVAERVVPAGESLLVLTRQTATGKSSGIPMDRQMADLLTVRDGLIAVYRSYWERDDAFTAAGVRP